MLSRISGVLVVLVALLFAGPARAKAQMDSPYTYRQTFGSALRLAKVDMRLEVTEVNAEWGYLLFYYVSADSGKRKNHGSIQFVASESSGIIKVTIVLPQMPSYHEELLLDKLKQKLQDEHGAPPPRPKKDNDDDNSKKKDGEDGDKDKGKKEGAKDDADNRGRNPDNVVILEPKRDSLKKKKR